MLYYSLAGKRFDLPAIKFIRAAGTGALVWESRAGRGGFIEDVCQSGKMPACLPQPQFYRSNPPAGAAGAGCSAPTGSPD
ncbi:hypothetical protein [Kamptonema formosum]|uniref:hypothetical protein n=1 Tax=Kamptonema formosum TaxID=331992 RepID=UPI000346912F|nr:hypothetical protein [Oscillatoria sp. PCC 10802]